MVPLNVRSAYSLLQSPMLPNQYINNAKQLGYKSIGLSDDQNLYAMVNFYQRAKQADLKPLLGLTIEIQGLLNTEMTFPLHIYVKNKVGYQNLLIIASQQQTQNIALNITKLSQKNLLKGLFIIIPPISELSLNLMNNFDKGQKLIDQFSKFINPQQLFLGIDLKMNEKLLKLEKSLSEKTKIPLIAFDEIRYIKPQDNFAYNVLTHIKLKKTITNIGSLKKELGDQYLMPINEWYYAYTKLGLKSAADQTDVLTQQVDFVLSQKKVELPHFFENKQISKRKLFELAQSGLNNLSILEVNKNKYQQRLEYELKIINDLDFDDYFLIVWDVINYSKQHNIIVGPGRGSSAGSLVAYCLGITEVDPIEYDLLFERFLNPKRKQMPDIDIDIPDNKREIILDYLHTKYGHNKIAQIITFSTMGMKQSLRDVSYVFGLKPTEIDNLLNNLPKNVINLYEAYQKSQNFQNAIIDLSVDGNLLLQIASQLTGIPRNSSVHSAGVVISNTPLIESIPVKLGDDNRLLTQLTKKPVEQLGLLKIDFLALSNLNVLTNALNEVYKVNFNFNIKKIDFNDSKTLALFRSGLTNGVFQFESNGMKKMLQQMKPDSFNDLIAANAIYRPGPMKNIPNFIARKHKQETIPKIDDTIDEFLSPTYGVIVYQEQVMRVAQNFANFNLTDADLLRRAISKKDVSQMRIIKNKFLQGAQQKNHSKNLAEKVYQYIERFGSYGFNKAHAVAYSKLAFELAFLKVHYPLAFYKAILNMEINNQNKVRIYINEAKTQNIKILGPNINYSFSGYSILSNNLQIGLSSIKGLSKDFRDHLITIRKAEGKFTSIENFLIRIDSSFRKMNLLEPLIMAGGFDVLQPNRRTLNDIMPRYLETIKFSRNSLELLNDLKPKIIQKTDYSKLEKLNQEFKVMGFYLNDHPLEKILHHLNKDKYTNTSELIANQNNVKLILMIDNIKIIRTKKGEKMAFVDASDLTGKLSLTFFAQQYNQYKDKLINGKFIEVSGKTKYQRNKFDLQLIVNQLIPIEKLVQQNKKTINLNVDYGIWFISPYNWPITDERLKNILQIAKELPGPNRVVLINSKNKKQKTELSKDYYLSSDSIVEQKLARIFGKQRILFKK